MRAFAQLVDRLSQTRSGKTQQVLLSDYMSTTPDPERGYALALLTGALSLPRLKPAALRDLARRHGDERLFALAQDFVGDLSETVALTWPDRQGQNRRPDLSEVIETLTALGADAPKHAMEDLLGRLEADGRWATLKLATGGVRLKLPSQTALLALKRQAAAHSNEALSSEIEEVWRSLPPPYVQLFAWLENRASKPETLTPGRFRPLMLAQAVDSETDTSLFHPSNYAAEWMWDGMRVQLVRETGVAKLYGRTGEDLSSAFPDLLAETGFEGVIDGQLVIRRGSIVGSPSDLQQRVGRKSPTAQLMQAHPAAILAYDLLCEAGEDLRSQSFRTRRRRLEALVAKEGGARVGLSPLLSFDGPGNMESLRTTPSDDVSNVAAGLVLKSWDSPYLAGREHGGWLKWCRDPFRIHAVLLYVQRSDGARTGDPLELTFGVWRDGQLIPVGKVGLEGASDVLKELEAFVRTSTVEKFGPVRRVVAEPDRGVVLEIAFAGVLSSSRHKSGLILRQPRLLGLRTHKTPQEAAQISALESFLNLKSDEAGPDIQNDVL